MAREEIIEIIDKLRSSQANVSRAVISSVKYEDLEKQAQDGSTVKDILQNWVHELWSHHRDLILARGRLINDNPHFHVPNFVRQANEEFGKFIGELSALSDEDLDRRVQPDGRTIREICEHVHGVLHGYFIEGLMSAVDR